MDKSITKINKAIVLFLVAMLSISCAKIQGPWADLYLEQAEKGFVSERPADRKDDNLISGNGTIGALIPGQVQQDKILFSHEKIFCPVNKPMKAPNMANKMDLYRKWALEGEGHKALKDIWEESQEMGYPDPIWWTDSYMPAGYLVFEMEEKDSTLGYARSTDWENGLTTVAWRNGEDVYHRKLFVSRSAGVSVMLIESPTGAALNCNFRHEELEVDRNKKEYWKDPEFYDENIESIISEVDGDMLTFKMNFIKDWEGSLKQVNMVSKVIPVKGTLSFDGESLKVSGARKILILTTIEPEFETPSTSFSNLYEKLNKIEPDFDNLLSEHAAIHGEMFNRIDFKITDHTTDNTTSEEFFDASKIGQISNAHIEKLFYAARYGAISSSGEYPPNLKGIWGTKWRAGWSGDMTQDGNVQSAIAAALSGNHFEMMRTYLDYMSSFIEDFKVNAKDLYNIDGIWVPSKMSNSGKVYHYSWYEDRTFGFPGVFWVGGAAWTSQFYYDYWLYTGDDQFLKQQTIPFMEGSTQFYEQYLYEEDGRYIVNPSYSPEIRPLNVTANVVTNATMDIASIKQLLRNMLALADAGHIHPDKERIANWKDIIKRLPPYAISADGAFKEWISPGLENDDRHRHCSHLYPWYYEMDPEVENSESFKLACTKAIENRLVHRRKIKGGKMAYGLHFLGSAAAHIGNSEQAYECLDMLAARYWTTSMASTHNPKKMMNMDISGGYPSLIIEMLMYSRNDFIELLPALPEQWSKGTITGLRAKGGFEVDIEWQEGELVQATITSKLGKPCKLRYRDKIIVVDIKEGMSVKLNEELSVIG